MRTVTLIIDFKAPWRCGVGRGDYYLDGFVARDRYGLPVVPGRTVNGVLRDALFEAAQDGVVAAEVIRRWFGSRGADPNKPAYKTERGALEIDDAHIDETTFAWFRANPEDDARRKARALLFADVETTAIAESGSARTGTLRRLEVVVPLTMTASIAGPCGAPGSSDDWTAVLKLGLPYVVGFGAGRTRGFGRCALNLTVGGAND